MQISFNNIFKEGTRYKALFLSLLLCATSNVYVQDISDNQEEMRATR